MHDDRFEEKKPLIRSKNKTFVVLSPGFPKNEQDTNCLPFIQSFINHFQQHSAIAVEVLAFQYPFSTKEYKWNGVTVSAFGGANRGKLFRLRTWYRVWKKLKHLQREYEITGVLNFWVGECALIGSLFAKRNDLPYYHWILGQDARLSNRYQKIIRPNPQNLIALSDFLADEYQRNFGARPKHIIPIGIDPKLFPVAKPERDIDIMGAGSLIQLKRFDVFIKIVQKLCHHHPNLKASICGSGPEEKHLQALINEARLNNNIVLKGDMAHREVLALMQRARVFFHPSAYEGNVAVCAEALFAGAFVVSFCKPMNLVSKQHYIIDTEQSAFAVIDSLLNSKNLNNESILTTSISDVVRKVGDLFAYHRLTDKL